MRTYKINIHILNLLKYIHFNLLNIPFYLSLFSINVDRFELLATTEKNAKYSIDHSMLEDLLSTFKIFNITLLCGNIMLSYRLSLPH